MNHTVRLWSLGLGIGLVGFLLPGAVVPQLLRSPLTAYEGLNQLANVLEEGRSPLSSESSSLAKSVQLSAEPNSSSARKPIAPLPESVQPASSHLITSHQGIHLEVSLSRRRVTVYEGGTPIKHYPIAIGRRGWETPTGTFEVKQLFIQPQWIHPFTDEVIAATDPRNPLGQYWIGFWSDGKNWIGFHGTPDQKSVGLAASHGCLRMHNTDVAELFQVVQLGTVVTVKQ